MKKLDLSEVTDVASFPLKSGSMDFIQAAYQETATAIITSLLGFAPDPTKGYIISGGQVTINGSNYTFTNGYIYFNNELFKLNGSSFTLTSGQQVVGMISNIPYPNADPVLFGDSIQRTVHLDRQMSFISAASGDLLYINVIRAGAWLTGDIKEIDVTNTYLTANFDATGLGINERVGWAICNGNNGTKNRKGRVGVQYDSSLYPTLGFLGGESSHILTLNELPAHTHDVIASNQKVGTGNPNGFGNSGVGATLTTQSAGGGAAHNNMQPYIVTLYIQKI